VPSADQNNFDLLRLTFAMMVCLVHAHELSGLASLQVLSAVISSAVAVKCFFVVSGFLIVISCERSHTLASYAGKRVRRIYPAYLLVIFACALLLPWTFQQDGARYFSREWFRYLVVNGVFLNFLQPGLPGVFADNRIQAINGALWTLKIEVLFYIAVPFIVVAMRRWGRLQVLAILYLLSVAYASVLLHAADRTGSGMFAELARQLPGQLSYFMAGAFYACFFGVLKTKMSLLMLVSAAVLTVHAFIPLPLLEPFALGSLVMVLAYARPLGHFSRFGDFSYGLYIVHFPIIQLWLSSGLLQDAPWLFLATVVASSLACAALLWHAVEKHFLARSNHYLSEAQRADTLVATKPGRAT